MKLLALRRVLAIEEGTYGTNGTYVLWLVTANCRPPTANGKLLTAPLESVMFGNLIDAINSNTEIIDEAVL